MLAKLLLSGLLVVHGLIHVLGVAITLGGATVQGMSAEPTLRIGSARPLFGLVWLAALALLVVAGGAVLFDQSWWRPLALVGALLSMVGVVWWWNDAWAGAVANVLVLTAVLLAPRISGLPV